MNVKLARLPKTVQIAVWKNVAVGSLLIKIEN